MPLTTLDDPGEPYLAIPATAVATVAPSGEGIHSGRFSRVRTLFNYSGTVNACTAKIWFQDDATGEWYEGASTDDLDPLTPGGASPIDESREWDVGMAQEIALQIPTISGGGTVAVWVQGVGD